METRIKKFPVRLLLAKMFLLSIGILLILQVSSCSDSISNDGKNKKGVIVSILPQAEFAEKIGNDKIRITVMIPPGASPHTYEPTPGQLEEISRAELYAKVGSGVEFELAWMDKIIKMNRKILLVDCSRNIDIIDTRAEYSGTDLRGKDPHIWLSPLNAVIIVENIFNGLVEIDPDNRDFYLENKEDYQEELIELDNQIREMLSGKKNRKILVFHPAWTYFAEEYGLEQISVEEEGKEPTIKGMEELIEQALENDIKVLFASPEFSTKSAETIAREIGGSVVLISPLEKDYVSNLRNAAAVFAESME
jgi:zinc transport system substrate-binding protein